MFHGSCSPTLLLAAVAHLFHLLSDGPSWQPRFLALSLLLAPDMQAWLWGAVLLWTPPPRPLSAPLYRSSPPHFMPALYTLGTHPCPRASEPAASPSGMPLLVWLFFIILVSVPSPFLRWLPWPTEVCRPPQPGTVPMSPKSSWGGSGRGCRRRGWSTGMQGWRERWAREGV